MIVVMIVVVALATFVRYGIIAVPTPGVAAANPPRGQPAAFNGTVLFKCFKRVGAAGWLIAAAMANPWGQQKPVSAHRQGDDMGKGCHGLLWIFCRARIRSACNSI